MVDCFLQMVHLLSIINALPETSNQEFRNNCLQIINQRWNQFDFKLYLLAYFFHPKFRCK